MPSAPAVYLGLTDPAVVDDFRRELEQSRERGEPVDIEEFVIKHPSRTHDLFLIPPGAVHGSGRATVGPKRLPRS